MATEAQKSNIISQGRQLASRALSEFGEMSTFIASYNAGDYASLQDSDFIGENTGITAADFTDWVNAMKAIKDAWTAGQIVDAQKVTI
jgi:hypothetical protein